MRWETFEVGTGQRVAWECLSRAVLSLNRDGHISELCLAMRWSGDCRIAAAGYPESACH